MLVAMVKLKCLFLSLVAVLLMATAAQAAELYASPSGSGTTCSSASPCGLQTGISRMAASDHLNLYGGKYSIADAWFNPIPSGVNGNPTNVRAVAGQQPVLDGGCPVANGTTDTDVGTGQVLPAGRCKTGGSNGELYTATGKSDITFGPGLTFQHFDNGFGNGVFTPGSDVRLRWTGNVFNNNGANSPGRFENDHDIYTAGGACGANHDLMIDHNWMGNSPGGALHSYHYCQGNNVDFVDNIVVNHAVGVFACDDAENYRIVNNTFVNSFGRASITTYCGEVTGPKPVVIRNNIFTRSGGTQWERSSDSQGIEDHNIWYGGSSPGTGAGDKTSNPLLDSNYKPQSGSPAIDAGSSVLAPATDYAGTARPQGAAFDIGAFEVGGTPPPPAAQCADGKDNDADGKIDFPADPGCSSASDNDETDAVTPPPTSKTLVADADTYIDQATPATNYGSTINLDVNGDTTGTCYGSCVRALVEFPGVPATRTAAKVRVWATAASSTPLQVRSIDQGCGWVWNTVTWNSRPDQGAVLGQTASTLAGWNEITIPASALTTGTSCLYVTKSGTTRTSLHSLSGAHPPELVVG